MAFRRGSAQRTTVKFGPGHDDFEFFCQWLTGARTHRGSGRQEDENFEAGRVWAHRCVDEANKWLDEIFDDTAAELLERERLVTA